MDTKEKSCGLQYIRAIACIGIIFIHTIYSAIVLFGAELSNSAIVLYRSILNNLMWAVPCFFMVTGVLLLNPEKEIGYKKLFKKYIARVLKAIVFFGMIYTFLEFIFSNDQTGVKQILNGLYEIFAGKSWSHMWYLYSLIGIYLLLPFYRMISGNCSEKDMRYLLLVYFIFISILPVLNIWGIDCGFSIHIATIYPFFVFLGYYMNCWGMQKNVIFYAVLVLCSVISIVVLTWLRWSYGLEPLERFFGYSSCFVIIQTIGVFALVNNKLFSRKNMAGAVLCFIDKHSFGIYLIHLIFIRGIYKHLHFNPFQSGGFVAIVGVVLVSLVLSIVVDVILKKIPIFKTIL